MLERVPRAVWGMMYADEADFVSRSPEGLARVMTVSEKKTETLLMRAPEKLREPVEPRQPSPPKLVIEVTAQKYAWVERAPTFVRPCDRGWRSDV